MPGSRRQRALRAVVSVLEAAAVMALWLVLAYVLGQLILALTA